MINQEIFVTLQIEGIHRWETCPIEEVDFLRWDHRHIFHIKAYHEVLHSDRDVEFIFWKRDIQDYLRNKYYNAEKRLHYFGKMSCEMLAVELIQQFNMTRCEVSEDNENGSICTVIKE